MTRYGVALGSNLGDRLGILRSAVSDIATFATNIKSSSLYETAPVGGPQQQGPYLNAAVVFETSLEPMELLHRLQSIETSHGRERTQRWGPRTLDLDIIVSDGGAFDDPPELVVPHPLAGERLFVVRPMIDVWPEAEVAPDVSFVDVYARVVDQEADMVATTWVDDFGSRGRRLVMLQLIFFVAIGILVVVDGSVPSRYGWPQAIGLVAVGFGGYLLMRSSLALGKSLVPMPEPVAGGSLVEDGPYRYVRHPIYTAIILMFAGVSLISSSWLAGIGTLGLYLLFVDKSRYEEGLLRIAYPSYRAYMKRVRFRIPFLT